MNSHAQDPTGLSYNVLSLFFCLLLSLVRGVCLCVQVSVYVGVHLCVDKCMWRPEDNHRCYIPQEPSPRSAFGLHTCAHTHVLNLHYAYTYHNAPICPTLLANEETKIITTALCHILDTVPTAHTRLTHISRLHWEVTETHISS